MSQERGIKITQINLPDVSYFILATITCINESLNNLVMFLTCGPLQWSDLVDYMELEGEPRVSKELIDNFNLSEDHRGKMKEYPREHFHLELKNYSAD